MKDFMIKTFRGHQFEFKRVLSSSFDPWYHISVTLDDTVVQYRMHTDKDGIWKIPAKRLPLLLYSLENEFSELLKLNERPVKHNRLPDHYNTD
jgi:hypothetical protein